MQKFHAQAIYSRTKDLLRKEIKEIEDEIASKQAQSKEAEQKAVKVPSRLVTELTEHAFDESDNFVKIHVPFNYCKITDDNVELELTENSFCVNVNGDSKDYRFNVRNLLKEIDVSKSYKKVKPDIISVYLKKSKGKFVAVTV